MSSYAADLVAPTHGGGLAAIEQRSGAWFTAERERWALWAPVMVGLGIAFYFSLPTEPPSWLGPTLAAGLGVASVLALGRIDRSPCLRLAVAGALAIAAGFAAAQIKALVVDTRMLNERIGPTLLTGLVDNVESFPDGQRVTLRRPAIAGLSPEKAPNAARLRLRGAQPAIHAGDMISVRAVLTPPPPPPVPGGYDFQRQAYFDGLGAVGYAVGGATVRSGGDSSLGAARWFARLRAVVGERVRAHLDGATAAVAIALLNGEQQAIPPRVMAAIRDSGLAHLLSISGLHIGLVAGIVMFFVRAALALVPAIALRFPIKKWAALVSVAAAGAYTLLAAAPVPSQRSFLMIAVVLLATLADRQGLSMRLLAFAALAVLLTQPEAMLGPSFQMSFAAVLGLMAAYEFVRAHRLDVGSSPGRRALVYLGGILLSTLIAGTASAPFAAYHFDRFQVYGVAANMIAVPVTGFWIMPWAVLAMLLMPFGLEGMPLAPLAWGVDVVIWVAEEVAAWPGAVVLLTPMPTWGLGAITLGGLWLCIWRRWWRWFGLAGIGAGLAAMATVEVPHLFIDGSGRLIAARTADGGLLVSSKGAGRSTREAWLRRTGNQSAAGYWPKQGANADGGLRCDALGCVYRINEHVLAVATRGEALIEDCRLADVVISLTPVRGSCPSATTLLDRFDLWRNGAHVLWLDRGAVRVESVNGVRGDRPWVLRPRPTAVPEADEDPDATFDAPSPGSQ